MKNDKPPINLGDLRNGSRTITLNRGLVLPTKKLRFISDDEISYPTIWEVIIYDLEVLLLFVPVVL